MSVYAKIAGATEIDKRYDHDELYEALTNNSYNLALVDVLMPGGSGPEAVNKVKEEGNFQVERLIYVTGCAGDKRRYAPGHLT